jgi:oxygen-dependent protoporphyrinogen oxidase
VKTIAAGPRSAFRLMLQNGESLDADAVVLAGSAGESSSIVRVLDGDLADTLAAIPTAPLAVVCLGYDARAVEADRGPLDGFGYLIPRSEGPRLLGVLWDSSIYPGRAPQGKALLRAMIGGAHDPSAVHLPDDRLLQVVRDDLRQTMGLTVMPEFVRIYRHAQGIPQYTTGHLERLAGIDARLERHPGLFVAGNSYRGVAVNACVTDAQQLADGVIRSVAALRRRSQTLSLVTA